VAFVFSRYLTLARPNNVLRNAFRDLLNVMVEDESRFPSPLLHQAVMLAGSAFIEQETAGFDGSFLLNKCTAGQHDSLMKKRAREPGFILDRRTLFGRAKVRYLEKTKATASGD
jgi:hypothetical protein